jgi:hypothetical protein
MLSVSEIIALQKGNGPAILDRPANLDRREAFLKLNLERHLASIRYHHS